MLPTTTFSIVDFNDLFVIAIGLSAAYMLIRADGKGYSDGKFYTILSTITSNIKNWAISLHSKSVSKISTIDYYIDDTTQSATMLVKKHANELEKGINRVKGWNESCLKKWERTNYLHILTFSCFCFGLIMLIAGAFEQKHNFAPAPLLHWLLYTMLFLSIHSIIYEHINTETRFKIVRLLKPRVILHVAIISAGLIIGCFVNITPWPNLDMDVLTLIAVGMAFGGFIFYLCTILVAGFIISVITLGWTVVMRIKIAIVLKLIINKDLEYIKELIEGGKDAKLGDFILTNETSDSPNK